MDIRIEATNIAAGLGRGVSAAPGTERVADQAPPAAGGGAPSQGPSFLNALQDAVHTVQGLQAEAGHQVRQVLTGADGQELHTAMIAMEKADLAFQLMMQVRNKIVQAYQEVSRMPF